MLFSLASTFVDARNHLPKDIQRRIASTVEKFSTNSSLNGLNYEQIKAKDNDIYSIRVNDDYRIILKRLDNNVAIFLYVDKHDLAYQWAEKHTCEPDINGTWSVHEVVPPVRGMSNGKLTSRFSLLTDSVLKELKVPVEYWNDLRTKVFIPNQFAPYKDSLSEEAYYILEEILKGMEIELISYWIIEK